LTASESEEQTHPLRVLERGGTVISNTRIKLPGGVQEEFQGENLSFSTARTVLCELFLGRFTTPSLPQSLLMWKH